MEVLLLTSFSVSFNNIFVFLYLKRPECFHILLFACCCLFILFFHNNKQLFTEVEVNNGGYLPSREAVVYTTQVEYRK